MELTSKPDSLKSTPATSPGLFSPSPPPQRGLTSADDDTANHSPYLHPLQVHKVKETHKAQVEQDFITGRKLINQYEIIDEIGRGVHGKVKLARDLVSGEYVAIKIIQRFSKKRRLGRVTVSPEDKTKREIAILKKVRHANVVGLLEVIDDPELKKIYMILEHVELGEIVWRKKGFPPICLFERRRIERESKGIYDGGEAERLYRMLDRQRRQKKLKQERLSATVPGSHEHWSLEHGDDESESDALSRQSTQESLYVRGSSHIDRWRSETNSADASHATSRAVSRTPSRASGRIHTPLPTEWDIGPLDSDNEEDNDAQYSGSGASYTMSRSAHSSGHNLDAHMHMQQVDDFAFRGRSPSMADSIISHMSSIDGAQPPEQFEEEYSYVPCFTIEQARSTFRDTVLGLEYLHYEGIVHRDIKPANLLWTKDHRVKISDFGVSYFGRPIREGEPDENVSESDARDFDDDLELAKTVGTPAFFAPELCYTDLDVEHPKVTEQIDVWSLGVTLFCLVFARIPFLAEDEYGLFRHIAHEDVYIPRRRLKAVNPSRTFSMTNLTSTTNPPDGPFRNEEDLEMEDIDDELHDLLRRMLCKDPLERLKLREVKRHPWVLRGIDNVIGWLDDTDPSRRSSGRRIQVDDRELERAVVPITFLERARTAVKKAVGKVIGRGESSRRRAVSSATSSGGEPNAFAPLTPVKDSRRQSLKADESYFHGLKESREANEHPLSQSVTASPDQSTTQFDKFSQSFTSLSTSVPMPEMPETLDSTTEKRPKGPDRTVSTAASIQTVIHRGNTYTTSLSGSPPLEDTVEDEETAGSHVHMSAFTDHLGGIFRDSGRALQAVIPEDLTIEDGDRTLRAKSMDRSLFNSNNKHSSPSVALSHAFAPGNIEIPEHAAETRAATTSSPRFSPVTTDLPSFVGTSHHRRPSILAAAATQSVSSPNVSERIHATLLEERPATATRILEGVTPPQRSWRPSTPETFSTAYGVLARRQTLEAQAEMRQRVAGSISRQISQSQPTSSCPPSPDDDTLAKHELIQTRPQSSASTGTTAPVSHFTSSVEVPAHSSALGTAGISSPPINQNDSQDQLYPSHPSLPTLLSGSSSVSATDAENEFLSQSGTVTNQESLPSDSETLTPPVSLFKQDSQDNDTADGAGISVVGDDDDGYTADGDAAVAVDHDDEDDDDDSDSDDGLIMIARTTSGAHRTTARRDTNISMASTETAKNVPLRE